MEEVPKKFYVAYKISQNIVCMEVKPQKVILYLKLNPKELKSLPKNARDVSEIGHYGTGDLELTVNSGESIEIAKEYIHFGI
jgi:predicted transport protein